MSSETKICANCQQSFIIEPDDFNFYEKISVPAPMWCPKCRFQRRMSWRNGWHLFKRKDSRTGEEIFSLFPQESPVTVYDRDFWWSDGWDPMEFGQEYDSSRPFFEQFRDLLYRVPLPSHLVTNLVNCRYCTNASDCKNCYLVRGATYTEDSAYIYWDTGSRQCLDSHMTTKCELGYGNVNTEKCYRTFFSTDCDDCTNNMFCSDCVGCNDCLGCFGLRSKSYCIFNEPYSKEEYKKKIEDMDLGSQANFEKLKKQAYAFWATKPHKFMHGLRNIASSGDYVYESKNAKKCYRVRGMEDSKYCQNILEKSAKDCWDYSNFGEGAELCYETLISGRGASNIKFCSQVYINVKNIEYSIFCHNSSDLFGCVSLRDKQYCIMNKQYDKETYEKLRSKIIEQMRKAGEYGEFFPPQYSYFPYYISEANEFFPMSEQEAKSKGFNWYEITRQKHTADLSARDLPDHISDATDVLLRQVIGCEHEGTCAQECTGAFRIIADELAFLKRMSLPLPRLCPNCRHYERLTLRNPPKFYNRTCAKCNAEFETSYAPERQEIIYCERCYQQEVI